MFFVVLFLFLSLTITAFNNFNSNVLDLSDSALAMGWTGPAAPSSCCWGSSAASTSLTSATISSKCRDRTARTRSSRTWWVNSALQARGGTFVSFLLFYVSTASFPFFFSCSRWRRWRTASGSTRSSTTRSSPSSTSTWRRWRRTVPRWSMFVASSRLYTSRWPPPVEAEPCPSPPPSLTHVVHTHR